MLPYIVFFSVILAGACNSFVDIELTEGDCHWINIDRT